MRQQISHAGQVRCQNGLDLLTEFELARSLSNSTTTSEVPSLVVDNSRCDTGMTTSSLESPVFTEASPSIIGFGAEDVGFGMPSCAPEMQQHLSFGHDFPLFPPSPHVDMGASWQAPSFPSIPGSTFDESRLYPDLSLGP